MIPVTRPVLPPFDEYVARLRVIWESGHLTNDGPMLRELETRLAEFFGVRHAIVVTNGTIAIQIAIRATGMAGRVVTTPFSYVATTASLVWEGREPIFADVEPGGLTMSASAAAEAADAGIGGLLATHVYGNPCDIEGLDAVARRYGVPIVFDAAHAFGARFAGRSLCAYGTAATLSFHATKLFHTVEGGAVVTDDPDVAARARQLRNFGQTAPDEIVSLGINGKNSELHAAMGLCLLPRVAALIEERGRLSAEYDRVLTGGAPAVAPIAWRPGTSRNYSYYPVMFDSEQQLLRAVSALEAYDIRARRYFRPSLSRLPYVRSGKTPVSDSAADRALCLPLYVGLDVATVRRIAEIVCESASAGGAA